MLGTGSMSPEERNPVVDVMLLVLYIPLPRCRLAKVDIPLIRVLDSLDQLTAREKKPFGPRFIQQCSVAEPWLPDPTHSYIEL